MTQRGHSSEVLQLSKALLHLHKALLDGERAAYERLHGPICSNGAFLQLVLGHPSFAWLRDLSRSMARLDELAEGKDASCGEALHAQNGVAPDAPGAQEGWRGIQSAVSRRARTGPGCRACACGGRGIAR